MALTIALFVTSFSSRLPLSAGTDGNFLLEPGINELTVYTGKDQRDHALKGTTVSSDEIAKVHSKIRALYGAGILFFLGKAIRDLNRQLKSAKSGEKLHVTGLDENVVDVEIETGMAFPIRHSDLERVVYVHQDFSRTHYLNS